ncbi:telomerase reverse transcriptase [Aspergillus saccharolyticus JOP 1030-1]|uniref:Telomerase reverse transcriptase n=1 Tax=Aspergillus saccharolyticus JOP 1030-1 TaxID=1450539 RepID=A0A318ZAL8_9EURO|nr:hypothetical protein BP01DRAFT_300997 [Aspergillus saccharolyticus JOP 1030-1]PYH43364.1 hypothetical protein BP01DRAFT_300997 [Aspergillus saccharolyticus JOP 1030-1]
MGKKRKRPVKGKRAQAHSSQTRITAASTDFRDQSGFASDRATEITHPVISLYYNEVVTLRQFLLRQIPAASRSRRRRIASIRADLSEGADKLSLSSQCGLATLLDSTLVGIPQDSAIACDQERGQELAALRKSQPHSQLDSTDTGPPCAQAELVDRAIQLIWKPFLSETKKRPHHLLTRGFRNPFETFFPNENVQKLKSSPWTEVLGLVGSNGEIIMLRLLCDCGIFVALDSRKGIYHQICGQSLEKLEPIFNKPQHLSLKPTRTRSEGKSSVIADGQQEKKVGSHSDQQPQRRTPNSIFFNRYRMLYAFPKKANNWKSQPGLGSHVLNRCPYPKSQWRAIHVMQHIFPSQFGLTNVFNPDPENDSKYLSREDEIAARSRKRRWIASNCVHQDTNDEVPLADIPKRLRGQALDLVQQILHRHKRCQYRYLLDYYCSPANVGPWKFGAYDSQSSFQSNPVGSAKLITQLEGPGKQALHADAAVSEAQKTSCSIPRPTVDTVNLVSEPAVVSKPSLTYYATPASSVSAYCQAVIRKLIPPQFYGTGQNGINNQSVILKNVDEFIRMRRFENLSLQEVCKGVKVRLRKLKSNSCHAY